jgi:hypothetical protein
MLEFSFYVTISLFSSSFAAHQLVLGGTCPLFEFLLRFVLAMFQSVVAGTQLV